MNVTSKISSNFTGDTCNLANTGLKQIILYHQLLIQKQDIYLLKLIVTSEAVYLKTASITVAGQVKTQG